MDDDGIGYTGESCGTKCGSFSQYSETYFSPDNGTHGYDRCTISDGCDDDNGADCYCRKLLFPHYDDDGMKATASRFSFRFGIPTVACDSGKEYCWGVCGSLDYIECQYGDVAYCPGYDYGATASSRRRLESAPNAQRR